MRLSITIDPEDGTGVQRRDMVLPNELTNPEGLWYYIVRLGVEALRNWKHQSLRKRWKREPTQTAIREASAEWEAPTNRFRLPWGMSPTV